MNITLVCAGGVSTSIMCRAIINAAAKKGFHHVNCDAYPMDKLEEVVANSDVILVGPQISFRFEQIKNEYPDIPCILMNFMDYGAMNGEKIFTELINTYGFTDEEVIL